MLQLHLGGKKTKTTMYLFVCRHFSQQPLDWGRSLGFSTGIFSHLCLAICSSRWAPIPLAEARFWLKQRPGWDSGFTPGQFPAVNVFSFGQARSWLRPFTHVALYSCRWRASKPNACACCKGVRGSFHFSEGGHWPLVSLPERWWHPSPGGGCASASALHTPTCPNCTRRCTCNDSGVRSEDEQPIV